MAFEIRLESSAPPERVLTAIKENTREWRESKIPRPLWKRGVLQVVGEVKPPRFRLRYDRRWNYGDGGDPLALVGEVRSDGRGGSRVVARCGAPGAVRWTVLLFGALLAWDLIAGGGISWSLVFLGLGFVAIAGFNDRAVSRQGDSEAEYLAARLEEAVKAAAAPASDAQPV